MAAPSTPSDGRGVGRSNRNVLEAASWRALAPPAEEGETIEVGVVETHPSLDRVAYATRSRHDRSRDLGRTRIVVHDFDCDRDLDGSGDNDGRLVSSFSLRELNRRINEFRTKSHLSTMAASAAAHGPRSREMLHSLAATPTSAMPYTVQMLGAVQRVSFLSRDAVRCLVPPGYVRDERSRMQRLLIGFRRCAVVVSVFHLKDQRQDACARGVQVMAYIGPDDLDEYEHDEKARKRQPSSYPIPISENILAYGCYDGGIRFYDFIRRKQAKSALGPNGRGNPIVRVINANSTQSNSATPFDAERSMRAGCQTIKPRIISVCATGVAYLWELDLSIDLDNGEVLHFDIPPPLASFDGLVAAVSGKWGIPVRYPPSLSPTSIAALSPCSSWEQTDEVNAQFEVSFDPRRNFLSWVFSPDCVGSSLAPRAPREERLNMNAALVCWELTDLPRPEWPPPVLPPRCVAQLARTAGGKVSSEMVLPGIGGVLSDSHLVTCYVTSSNELVAAVTNLEKRGDSVQLESDVMNLVNLKTFNCDESYAIATSRSHSSSIAIGTRHGIIFMKVSETSDARKQLFPLQEETTDENGNGSISLSLSDSSSSKSSTSTRQPHTHAAKIKELESRNKDLECQLNDLRIASEVSLEKERNELQSRVKALLNQHADFCELSESELSTALSKVETLDNDLRLKNEICKGLESQIGMLKSNIAQISEELEEKRQTNEEAALKLATVEAEARTMENEIDAKNNSMRALQEECDGLRRQLDELAGSDERERNERDSILTRGDYSLAADTPTMLREELFTAKETEESLRNYIALLEEDKASMDKELEDARQEAEKYAEKCDDLTANLRAEAKEQKSAIDSLVDLLERQRRDHERDAADQNDEIWSLKKELSELRRKYQTNSDDANESNEDTMAKLKAENAVLRADASMGNEIYLAMKVELQNALNELAEYERGHKDRSSENSK